MAESSLSDPYVLDDAIGFILRQVGQRHAAIFSALMGESVTRMQWAALVKLEEVGNCSQNLLGRLTGMDGPTIKGVIGRLLHQGLIVSVPDPRHKRRISIELSDDGREFVREKSRIAQAVTRETLRPITKSEEERLIRILKKLR